jgi:hypothetical protein
MKHGVSLSTYKIFRRIKMSGRSVNKQAESSQQKEAQPPQPKEQGGQRGPESKALSISTAAAHAMRLSLNETAQHIQGLQEAYMTAAEPMVEETSNFLAGVISQELSWAEIDRRTRAKLQSAPKAEKVSLALDPLQYKGPSWKQDGEMPALFSGSSTIAFCLPEGK